MNFEFVPDEYILSSDLETHLEGGEEVVITLRHRYII